MDLYEMIRKGHFEPEFPHPSSPPKPFLPRTHTSSEVEAYARSLKEYEKAKLEFDIELKKWRERRNHLEDEFKEMALEYCGVSADNPKRNKLWSIARDMSFSHGYAEVLTKMEILAELIV